MRRYYLVYLSILFLVVNISFSHANKEDIQTLQRTSRAFNKVADISKPAVVSISTIKTIQNFGTSPFFDDPFFEHYYSFTSPRSSQKRTGLGSGVIVSK